MRERSFRKHIAVLAAAAVAMSAGAGPAAAGTSASKHKKAFHGNLCAAVTGPELVAAHVSGPCVQRRPVTLTLRTPLGTYTTERFTAQWGDLKAEPANFVSVTVTRLRGNATAIKFIQKRFRLEVLGNGEPVHVGSPGSVNAETLSCANAPTGDCTDANLLAVVGPYELAVQLVDHPPTNRAATEFPPGDDEPEDKAQQNTDKGPAVAIGQAVAAKL